MIIAIVLSGLAGFAFWDARTENAFNVLISLAAWIVFTVLVIIKIFA